MADPKVVSMLQDKAYEMRYKLLKLCGSFDGTVHVGGDLSMADLITALYHYGMNVDPKDIKMPERDRFLLGKGHGAVGMYITMALRGFFDMDEIFSTYGRLGSAYGMHPCKVNLPGVESSTGSLGHALPLGVGMAYSAKHRGEKHRVFVLMGDGETQEGSVWEAALSAPQFKLGNLVAIVDRNKVQLDSFTEELMKMEPYADKWRAFNWNVVTIDGHDMNQIVDAIDNLPPSDSDVPTVIIAATTKGKGVSYMENNPDWHAGCLCEEDMNRAITDIQKAYNREGSEA